MKIILSLLLSISATTVFAIDTSPYNAGQKLTDAQAKELQQRFKDREQQPWKEVGGIDSLKGHKDAKLIEYGIQVLDKTAQTIGPKVKDKSKRYSGNNLNCSSCHLKGSSQLPGTMHDAIPFTNIKNDYPQFRSRGMSVVTAASRVNGCMTRSMGDGKPLPLDSREMKGILAYYDWLGEDTKKDLAMGGTGLPKVALPDRKADAVAGKKVYQTNCMACHGKDAVGMKSPDFDKTGNYTFPPLAGDDTFNDGAGMSRQIKATAFIHANMPLGANSKTPILTVDQAYDVAAYILSLPRGHKEGRDKDFPDPNFRPADYAIPAYFDGDKKALEKAKSGPYKNH